MVKSVNPEPTHPHSVSDEMGLNGITQARCSVPGGATCSHPVLQAVRSQQGSKPSFSSPLPVGLFNAMTC